MSLPTPNTRKEQYLNAIATGNAGDLPTPITREEEYLDAIAKSGGGSGDGDMKKSVYDSDLDVANAGGIGAFVSDAISGKVDKVEGKGLSTNDYDDTEKEQNATNTSAIEAITEVYGAKNLLPNEVTTQTINGITYTVNADGSITADGTADANTDSVLDFCTTKTKVPEGSYIATGCPSGGSSSSYLIVIGKWNSSGVLIGTVDETGAGATVTINQQNVAFTGAIYIRRGTTVNNLTFYPMIRDARIADSTYVPYAMTNKQLTERGYREVSVVGDGVKTYGEKLYELYTLFPKASIHANCLTAKIVLARTVVPYVGSNASNDEAFFGCVQYATTQPVIVTIHLNTVASDCLFKFWNGTEYNDVTNAIVPNNEKIILYY